MSSTDAKQPEASQALVDDKPADADDDDLNDALFGDDEDDAQVEAGTEGAAPLAKDDEDPVAASRFQHSSLHEPAEAEDRLREEIAKRNQIIFSVMTEEQRAAHGAMRRANLNKRDVKRVLQTITGQNVSANVLLVMRGMAKVFVAELVEAAAVIAKDVGETGPILPSHYIAAYQQLDQQGKVPRKTPSKKLRL